MSHSLTIESILDNAARTHFSAAKLARAGGWFPGWRERRLVALIDHFIGALRHLSQHTIKHSTPDERVRLGQLIDTIVDDVEGCLASHHPHKVSQFERHRYLASRIYELRRACESISRGVTANPGVVDMQWEAKITGAARPK